MTIAKRIMIPLALLFLLCGTAAFYHYSQMQAEKASEITGFPPIDPKVLLEEAKQGKPYSQWAYAEMIEMRLVPNGTPLHAREWYQKAAAAGFRPAQVYLGLVKPTVGDFTMNVDTDARMLHLRAVGGDIKACKKLNEWYLEREEFKQSGYWLVQSVSKKLSHDPLENWIAAATLFSRGGKDEQRKAIEIMRTVTKLEPGYYGYDLAHMLETAQGDLRNPWEAERWYRKAAEAGNPQAQVRMGIMYLEGDLIGFRSDYEALRWLKKAAEPRKNRYGFSYVKPSVKLALLYYLDKGVEGSHGFLNRSPILPSELEYLMLQDGYDLQKAYYATAIGIRNTNIDFVRKEANAAAKYGKQGCGNDPECLAFGTWFQLLAGQSDEVITDAKRLKGRTTAKVLFHLGHAMLLHNRKEEALQMYEKGIAKATRHELFQLDDELDLLGWHFSSSHLLFAAVRQLVNDRTRIVDEEKMLQFEEVKALRAQLVKDGHLSE